MTIVSTKFSLDYSYDILYRDAFEICMANETCSEAVPTKLQIANEMVMDILNNETMSRTERNEMAETFLERVSFDDSYIEIYRLIFLNYKEKIASQQKSLDQIASDITKTETLKLSYATKVSENEIADVAETTFQNNKVLLAEATKNLTDYENKMTPILDGIESTFEDYLDN